MRSSVGALLLIEGEVEPIAVTVPAASREANLPILARAMDGQRSARVRFADGEVDRVVRQSRSGPRRSPCA